MTVSPQLVDYIKKQRATGKVDGIIRGELVGVGWAITDIEAALEESNRTEIQIPTPVAESVSMVNSGVGSAAVAEAGNSTNGATTTVGEVTTATVITSTTTTVATPIANVAPTAEKRSLPGVFDLLKEAFSAYTGRFWAILGAMLLPVIPGVLLAGIGVGAVLLTGIGTKLSDLTIPGGSETGAAALTNSFSGIGIGVVIGGLVYLVVAMLVMIYFGCWGQLTLMAVVFNRGAKMGVKEAMRVTRGKIGAFMWLTFLVGLVVSGGTVLFLIPGMIVSVFVSQAVYVLVVDGDRGMKTVIKSREYIRGYGWGVVGRLFITGLLIGVIVFVGGFVVGIVGGLLKAIKLEWLSTLISMAYQWIVQPLTLIVPLVLFEHLKKTKPDINSLVATKKSTKYTLLAILGTLAFFAIPIVAAISIVAINPSKQIGLARDMQRRADLKSISSAIEMYYSTSGVYPVDLTELVSGGYLSRVPVDPLTKSQYVYESDGAGYSVCSEHEGVPKSVPMCEPAEKLILQ